MVKSTIHKVAVPSKVDFTLDLPKGAEILEVQIQNDVPHLWYKFPVDENDTEKRTFTNILTGLQFSDDGNLKHIGTFQFKTPPYLVIHLFEVIK